MLDTIGFSYIGHAAEENLSMYLKEMIRDQEGEANITTQRPAGRFAANAPLPPKAFTTPPISKPVTLPELSLKSIQYPDIPSLNIKPVFGADK